MLFFSAGYKVWMSQKSTLGTTSTSQRSKHPWSAGTDLKSHLIQQNPMLAILFWQDLLAPHWVTRCNK